MAKGQKIFLGKPKTKVKIIKRRPKDKIVLVGVIKDRRDLNILLKENWYRIPVKHLPKRKFDYLAFYQPLSFGRKGKQIQYYAPVLDYKVIKRSDLLPEELEHPRAKDYYLKIQVGKAKKLARPIKNIIPRRISFGFTTLSHLLKSKDILQLYNVTPTEPMVEDGLKEAGIKATPQYYVRGKEKRFFLDFAIFCQKGKIAIECDNKKVHSLPSQKRKDKIKNAFLRKYGWTVIRLPEEKIVSDLPGCLKRVEKAIQKLGGLEK
jgi:very-short-patch-repair endonuclease